MQFIADSLSISTTLITAILAVISVITVIATLATRIAKTESTVEMLKAEVEALKKNDIGLTQAINELGGEIKAKLYEFGAQLREMRAEFRSQQQQTGRYSPLTPK